MPNRESAEPEVIIKPNTPFFLSPKFLAIGGILLLGGFLSWKIFLIKPVPPNLTGIPVQITPAENYGFTAGDLTLSCPLESNFCASQKLISLNKNPAVSYLGSSGSSVLNLVKVPSLENIGVLENKQVGKKYFYESIVSKTGNSCYTIAYTLPLDATFGDLLNLPFLGENVPIATLGTKTFKVEGDEVNVIIQIRNTPLDPGVPCSLIKKSPEFFKSF